MEQCTTYFLFHHREQHVVWWGFALHFLTVRTATSSIMATMATTPAPTTGASSNDQWRVFIGLALLVAAYVFRVEVVRFTLRLARRVLPPMFVWIKEFEKHMLRPLSWVVFLLLVWFALYVMDVSSLLGIDWDTVTSLVTLLLGFPLIWVVINLCNYVTWVSPPWFAALGPLRLIA
jgi:hypothetical protein